VFLVICFIGFVIRSHFQKRKKILTDAVLFCEILLADINFIQKPLPQNLKENEVNFSKEFNEILQNFISTLNGETKFIVDCNYLKKEDNEKLTNLFASLGKTDVLNQNAHIEGNKELLKVCRTIADTETKTKGSAYFKLTLCFACLMVVLMI
jgi:stage III sporulation protein AB